MIVVARFSRRPTGVNMKVISREVVDAMQNIIVRHEDVGLWSVGTRSGDMLGCIFHEGFGRFSWTSDTGRGRADSRGEAAIDLISAGFSYNGPSALA